MWYNKHMNNGHHGYNSFGQDSVPEGFTPGIGLNPESSNALPSVENLNDDSFNQHNFGMMGNAALNNLSGNTEQPQDLPPQMEMTMPPTPDQMNQMNQMTTSSQSASVVPDDLIKEQRDKDFYSHFTDGKIDGKDIQLLEIEEKERDPESLYELVRELRGIMTGRKQYE